MLVFFCIMKWHLFSLCRTQDSLKGGHFVSVLHVLTQLQRICNHPDLVDPRSGHSSYACEALQYNTASLVLRALEYDPWKVRDLYGPSLIDNLHTFKKTQSLNYKITKYYTWHIVKLPPSTLLSWAPAGSCEWKHSVKQSCKRTRPPENKSSRCAEVIDSMPPSPDRFTRIYTRNVA